MPSVTIKGDFEASLRRFKRDMEKSGKLTAVRSKQKFVPPSKIKQLRKQAAENRARRARAAQEKNERDGRR